MSNQKSEIIKEFLYHSLNDSQKKDLEMYFSNKSNNFSLNQKPVKNNLIVLEAHIKLMESICPLGDELPSHLSDLETSNKSFVLFDQVRKGCISKIDY